MRFAATIATIVLTIAASAAWAAKAMPDRAALALAQRLVLDT